MNHRIISFFLALIILLINCGFVTIASDIKFSGVSYISYESELNEQKAGFERFKINRAYLTGQKRVTDSMDFRITFDVYDDDDGVEVRLKYVYALHRIGDFLGINQMALKFGIIHTPWIDFEEHINLYRMQGPMFSERQKLFSSSDLGVNLSGLIGGMMEEKYINGVSSSRPGRYGSFDIGLYNGSGYNQFELNDNKVIQGRISLRPIPDIIPGMQASVFGMLGKGNFNKDYKTNPEWNQNIYMLSYESEVITATAQFIKGEGDFLGLMTDTIGTAIKYEGLSFFGEIKAIEKMSLIFRYDDFKPESLQSKYKEQRVIAGICYNLEKSAKLLLDFDRTMKEGNIKRDLVKFTLAVNY